MQFSTPPISPTGVMISIKGIKLIVIFFIMDYYLISAWPVDRYTIILPRKRCIYQAVLLFIIEKMHENMIK